MIARKAARMLSRGLCLIVLVGCQALAPVGPSGSEGHGPAAATNASVGSGPADRSASTGAPAALATAMTVAQPLTILVGESHVAALRATVPAGVARAFQYVAASTGTVTELSLYLDGKNAASQVVVGLYENSPTNHPGRLLAQGVIDSPITGAWSTVSVAPVGLTVGEKYWLAVLGPVGTGALQLRATPSGGLAEASPAANLSRLAASWLPGLTQVQSSLTAYAVQVGPGAPVISSVRAAHVGDSSATVTWTTDRPAAAQVHYGTSADYGDSSTFDPSLVISHTQVLGGLTPNTRFNYQVVSTDAGGTSTSANFTFVTQPAPAVAARMGEWSGVMRWPLVDVHMSLLYTGEVLMWDAWEFNGTPSVHLWNPNSQTFASLPNISSQMFCADETMLPNGRLLVTGGHNGADIGIKNTMVYDPATRTWLRVADLNTPRWYPTTIALPDGQVVALGGEVTRGVDATVPEVYNPTLNVWRALTRAALDIGQYPLSYLLPDGRLFIAAGVDDKSRTLDVTTQTWTTYGTNPAPTGTTAMYRPGKVLATGGGTAAADPVQATAATIDLTRRSPAWQDTAPMIHPRFKHSLVVLADGSVLAVGGSTIYSLISQTGVRDAELWDPNSGTWTLMAPMHDPRMYHSTALLLPDGRVLVAGGGRMDPVPDYNTAEIYSPPYLFKGPRPTLSSAPAATTYGSTLTVQTPDAARIASVALVRLGSITHTFDSDQRYVNLAFTTSAGALTLQSPANANLAPPGYYMLFIVDSSGVPSVAKILQVSGSSSPSVAR